MGRIIVALSGGKASAWCANWALENFPKEDVVLYFNDTKWEHPSLYKFLEDLKVYFDHDITVDADGRDVAQLCRDNRALANNRMAFCSRILKAERLQKFYQDGDQLVFGIDREEPQRVQRLVAVYQKVMATTDKACKVRVPLFEFGVSKDAVEDWFTSTGIDEPLLYTLGFKHNNCSGGCVRAGKKHWKLLYETLPEVYAEREAFENEMRSTLDKDIHFFKDETLTDFRGRIERKELSAYYDTAPDDGVDCIGICDNIT